MSNTKQDPAGKRNGNSADTGQPPKTTDTTLAAFIWKNAEDLWGDFRRSVATAESG